MKRLLIVSCLMLACKSAMAEIASQEFVPDADTVALWHLNGNGEDASGNGNHLAVKSDRVSWVPGKFGQCAEMGEDPWSGSCWNSDGGALTAPGAGCTYPGSGDWTVEAWLLFPSNSESYLAVSHYSKHWAGHDPYHLGVSSSQAFFQFEETPGNPNYISADISSYVGEWVHIAGVYRYRQDAALYVNGAQAAYQATTAAPEYLPSYDVFVGGCYCGTSTGLKVDEVRLSNVARYEVLEAAIDIDPNTLNLKSKGKWITCYIELPDGYDVDDIDVSTIKLNEQVSAESEPTAIGDYDGDGIVDLMVKFDRAAMQGILQVGDVEITVTGELTDGTLFEGIDTIRVIDKGGKE